MNFLYSGSWNDFYHNFPPVVVVKSIVARAEFGEFHSGAEEVRGDVKIGTLKDC
jgi:hypothetical protein